MIMQKCFYPYAFEIFYCASRSASVFLVESCYVGKMDGCFP